MPALIRLRSLSILLKVEACFLGSIKFLTTKFMLMQGLELETHHKWLSKIMAPLLSMRSIKSTSAQEAISLLCSQTKTLSRLKSNFNTGLTEYRCQHSDSGGINHLRHLKDRGSFCWSSSVCYVAQGSAYLVRDFSITKEKRPCKNLSWQIAKKVKNNQTLK